MTRPERVRPVSRWLAGGATVFTGGLSAAGREGGGGDGTPAGRGRRRIGLQPAGGRLGGGRGGTPRTGATAGPRLPVGAVRADPAVVHHRSRCRGGVGAEHRRHLRATRGTPGTGGEGVRGGPARRRRVRPAARCARRVRPGRGGTRWAGSAWPWRRGRTVRSWWCAARRSTDRPGSEGSSSVSRRARAVARPCGSRAGRRGCGVARWWRCTPGAVDLAVPRCPRPGTGTPLRLPGALRPRCSTTRCVRRPSRPAGPW
jgi:hypothetical protein